MLSLLAPLSVLGSDLSRGQAWPLAAAACAYGLWLVRREAGRARRHLVLGPAHAPGGPLDTLDGRRLLACRISWRGPLAFVHVIDGDGRSERLSWWPDTLPPTLRRELRLAATARVASRRDQPVAP